MWNKNNSHTHPVHADLPAYCRTMLKNQVKHGRYTIKKRGTFTSTSYSQ